MPNGIAFSSLFVLSAHWFHIFVLSVVAIMVLGLFAGVVGAEVYINDDSDFEDTYLAAPAVAGLLLEAAGISNRHGTGKTGGNYIADVARNMGENTDFEGVKKSDVFEYQYKIAQFLIDQGAAVALPQSTLMSVVYEGAGTTFGSAAGETLTLTFSHDVFLDGADQVAAQTRVFFTLSPQLGNSTAHMLYTAVGNKIVITSLVKFTDPRPDLGEWVTGLQGLVDVMGNDVVVPAGGVLITQ